MVLNNKGISVVQVVITIIILVLITSITVYSANGIIEETRQRSAMDRLMTVANLLVSHEKELGIYSEVLEFSGDKREVSGDSRYFMQVSNEFYDIMDLSTYKDTSKYPPVYFYKKMYTNEPEKRIYRLKTPKIIKKDGVYKEGDFIYYEYTAFNSESKDNYKIEFDVNKGVNRPLISKDMIPVITYFSDDGITSSVVDDIYEDDWYNYSNTATRWANVRMENNAYYVWIPRFAYRIQNYYSTSNITNVGNNAISIEFLQGTTDYKSNGEPISSDYQVHPAFRIKKGDGYKDISGFWVSKYNVENLVEFLYKDYESAANGYSAIDVCNLTNVLPNVDSTTMDSHLITNMEWSAIAYLSFFTSGKTNDGSSISNNPSAVMELNVPQYVAAGIQTGVGNYFSDFYDLYVYKEDLSGDKYKLTNLDYTSSTESANKKYGDAIFATSSGKSDKSAWFGGTSILPTSEAPFIIRGLDSNLFAYSSTPRNPSRGYACRNVLNVSTK